MNTFGAAEQDVEMAWDSPYHESDTVFIEKIMTNNLIYNEIFRSCLAPNLLRLAKTCRQCHTSVNSYIKRAFNINRRLGRFFPDPLVFRSIQAFTHTLISGSAALQFFDRSFYPDSDLDLYVDVKFKEYLAAYLMSVGYKFVPSRSQNEDFRVAATEPPLESPYEKMIGVAGVFTFRKDGSNGQDLKVQIIAAQTCAMEIVLHYHSTCVMNVIAFDKAYCLYPRATLEVRIALVPLQAEGAPKQEKALKKYRQRGWTTIHGDDLSEQVTINTLFRPGVRYISDRMSWILPLDMEGVTLIGVLSPKSTPMTRDPVVSTTWALTTDLVETARYRMAYRLLSSENLFYQYLTWEKAHYPKGSRKQDGLLEILFSKLSSQADMRYFDEEFTRTFEEYYDGVFK